MKTLRKTIDIHASKEMVWKVLTEDKYTRNWYAAFSEGAHAITDWKVNSKVIFKDPSGNGLIGKIVANTPYETLDVEYTGTLIKEREDYEHPDSVAIKGGHETYNLSEKNQQTTLSVASDMDEQFVDSMDASWNKALIKLKALAEAVKEN